MARGRWGLSCGRPCHERIHLLLQTPSHTMIPYLRRMHACRQASTRPPAKSCQSQNHGGRRSAAMNKLRQGGTTTPPPQLIKPETGTKTTTTPCWPPALTDCCQTQPRLKVECNPADQTYRLKEGQTLVNSMRPQNQPALRADLHASSVVQAAAQLCRNTRCKSHSDGDKTDTTKRRPAAP